MNQLIYELIHNGIIVGTAIPYYINETNIGGWIERILRSKGFVVNSTGIDISDGSNGIEIKTHKIPSNSGQQICKMTRDNIINTPYKNSRVHERLQMQYRVLHDNKTILSAEFYDFTIPHIQYEIEKSYEDCRELFKKGIEKKYVSHCPTNWGYFEYDKGNTFAFKIRKHCMNEMMQYATPRKDQIFESLFATSA